MGLELLWWGLLIAMVAFIGLFAYTIWTAESDVTFEMWGMASDVDTSGLRIRTVDGAERAFEFVEPTPVKVVVGSTSVGSMGHWIAVTFTIAVALSVFALGVIRLLRGLISSLESGEPFLLENARRLRLLGFLFVFAVIARVVGVAVSSAWVDQHMVAEGLNFSTRIGIDLTGVALGIAGLLMIAFSEVFRLGAEMQVERSLTI